VIIFHAQAFGVSPSGYNRRHPDRGEDLYTRCLSFGRYGVSAHFGFAGRPVTMLPGGVGPHPPVRVSGGHVWHTKAYV